MTISVAVGVIPPETVKDRLRRAREYAGLEQGELAEAIGVSRATVSNYERGVVAPRRGALRMWGLRCGVDVHWLETGTAKPRPDGPSGASELLQLDSNQQPFDYQSVQVTASGAEVIPLRFGRQAPAAARWIQDPVAA